jgi:hypothetical protein
VTDFGVPVMGIQGVLAILTVPYIVIKSQSLEPEKVRERLLSAAERISETLIGEGC